MRRLLSSTYHCQFLPAQCAFWGVNLSTHTTILLGRLVEGEAEGDDRSHLQDDEGHILKGLPDQLKQECVSQQEQAQEQEEKNIYINLNTVSVLSLD